MIDFTALKNNKGNNTQAMQKALEKTEGGNYDDPLIWKPTRDPVKQISMNVIRLLPISRADMEGAQSGKFPQEDLTPLVKLLRYSFKGANGWLNSLSPLTFGLEDPIKEWSMPQWSELKGKDKEDPIIKAKRERLKEFIASSEYYVNILVISDSQKPENNGKVFKFKFGEAVRKIIETAANPKFPTDPSFDAFCPWTGANLQYNLSYEERKFNGKDVFVPKFDAVKWAAVAPLGDDALIEKVWGESHPLMEYLDRTKYPTYEGLKEKFCKVMNLNANFEPVAPGSNISSQAQSFMNQQSQPQTQAQSQPTATNVLAAAQPQSQSVGAAVAIAQTQNSASSSDLDDLEAMLAQL